MAENWLITGGCGFIGINLIRRLGKDGCAAVRVLDNLSVGTLDDLRVVTGPVDLLPPDSESLPPPVPGRCQLIEGDIIDDGLALRVARDMDVIVHLAANTGVGPSVEDPRLDCLTNVLGTFNYLEAARNSRVSRFIFASSGAPAGEVEPPIHEELPPHPVSPYGASKLAGEGYCSAYKQTYGIDTVALRFGNVYGPGSTHKSSVVAKFIKRALEGAPLEIYGDGSQTRDFIYIDDLIDALMRVVTADGIGGEAFQIATHKETTISEMTNELLTALREAGIRNVTLINGDARLGDVKRNYSDTTKARKRLGWAAQVGLAEGLRRTVAYFLARKE
jgi:UDP-glucose 4-epimerase